MALDWRLKSHATDSKHLQDISYIFLRIFFGNKSDELPFDFLKAPFLSDLGFRLSVAGQPLFLLQAGAIKATEKSKNSMNAIREYFILMDKRKFDVQQFSE